MMSEKVFNSLKESYRIEATGIITAIEEFNVQIAELNPKDESFPKNHIVSIAQDRRLRLRKRLLKAEAVYIKWGMDPRVLSEVRTEIYSSLDHSKDDVETNHGMKR